MAKLKVKQADVIEAIQKAHGQKTGVCELLDISRPTLDRYLLLPAVAEAFEFAKIRRKDRAEYKLDEAIERGEAWAIQFALKNAKDREYSDRVDVNQTGDMRVIIEYADNQDSVTPPAPSADTDQE
jgi:hypothetical protein